MLFRSTVLLVMEIHRSIARRRLDRRLAGLIETVGPRPPSGWARTIRQALGMTTGDLAQRLAVSQPRVCQLERAEADGTIRLSGLRQLGDGLNCELVYALVPHEPLEHMVRQQARRKVAEEAALRLPEVPPEDESFVQELLRELLDGLAIERVDTHGLWRLREVNR